MDKEAIFNVLKERLTDEFKLAPDSITPDKHLSDDLDLDSLDMVDLILNLHDKIGDKASPALFKNAQTVQDIVDIVQPLWDK